MPNATMILNAAAIERALTRIAHEIAERNENSAEVALVGIHRGGVFLRLCRSHRTWNGYDRRAAKRNEPLEGDLGNCHTMRLRDTAQVNDKRACLLKTGTGKTPEIAANSAHAAGGSARAVIFPREYPL